MRADRFIDMPFSAQALYFHLGMEADDDGFVESPKSIARMIGARNEDLVTLAREGFVILFDTGIIVITDWLTNNHIRQDRKRETIHIDELAAVEVVNGRYVLLPSPAGVPNGNQMTTTCQPFDNQMTTNCQPNANQVTTSCQPSDNQMPAQGKVSKDKVSEENTPPPSKEAKGASLEGAPPAKKPARTFVPPTYDDVRAYASANGLVIDAETFVDFYTSKGWKVGRNAMKDWKAAVRYWCRRDSQKGNPRQGQLELSPAATDYSQYENIDDYFARINAEEAGNGNHEPA